MKKSSLKIGKLTIVVGLPGSGKSHLMKSLQKKATGICSDDFMAGTPIAPIVRDPSMTDSLHYSRLIRDLRAGKSCVISDIIFCDVLMRKQLELATRSEVRNLQLTWEFFENNKSACEKNARRRGRAESLARELTLIRFLSRKYFVPEGIKAHKVWGAKGKKI